MPLSETLETEAQRIANLIIKKHAKTFVVDNNKQGARYEHVDVSSIENTDVKTIGVEHLAYEAAKKISLPELLLNSGFSQKEVNTALASIIGRLIAPGSEVSTVNYLRNNSALDEILDTDFSNLHKNRLYKISDLLLKNQSAIESTLYQKEQELFSFSEVVTLYDLTNTYFEGESLRNDNAALGHSKEKPKAIPIISVSELILLTVFS